MRTLVIINPVSGTSDPISAARNRVGLATRLLQGEGLDFEVRLTEHPGHAYELARRAVDQGVPLVCAWGGDGTVSQVGRAVAFGQTSLGIVPAGSGNGLARELGIPTDPAAALTRAVHKVDRLIDAGEIDGRLFFSVAGVGLDADIAARHPVRAPGRYGTLLYVLAAIRQRLTYQPGYFTIDFDGGTFRGRSLAVVFANSRQYGHGAVVAPLAEIDDGALDLVTIEPAPFLVDLLRARRMFHRTLHRARGVTTAKVRRAEMRAEAAVPFHVDGEPMAGGPTLIVRAHSRALRVRA